MVCRQGGRCYRGHPVQTMNSTRVDAQRATLMHDAGSTALRIAVLSDCMARARPGERVQVAVAAELASTNAHLLTQARLQQPPQAMLLAVDHQTAGRGRHGRRWHARAGGALLYSLAVPLVQLPPALPAVTLACGVALVRALSARGVSVHLKWPNDLLLDGRKLGGLLFEVATDAAGGATLVAGVGINVQLSDADRAAIGQPAAALADVVAVDGDREEWIAMLAAALLDAIAAYVERGFEPWREPYIALLAGAGQLADIVDDGRVVAHGRIVDVDGEGRLALQTDAGRVVVSVGDVSLRVSASEAGR